MLSEATNQLGKRIGQYLIDYLMFIIPGYILMIVWTAIFNNSVLAAFGFLFILAGLAGFIWNYCVRPVQTGTGQTFGMQFLKLKMVMEDGSPLTMSATFLRWVLLIVDGFFCGIVGIVLISVDNEKHQRLGDKIAKTLVVGEEFAGNLAMGAYPGQGYAQQSPVAPGYPPQAPGYPPQAPGYPPQAPPPAPGYPPQDPGYPPPAPPPAPGYPPQPPQ